MDLQDALYEKWAQPEKPGWQTFVATSRGETFFVLHIADAAWENGWAFGQAGEEREGGAHE